jgi:hypothetical protein
MVTSVKLVAEDGEGFQQKPFLFGLQPSGYLTAMRGMSLEKEKVAEEEANEVNEVEKGEGGGARG